MNNKLYDYLKWAALIALPALATFVSAVLPAYGVENTETIVLTITSVGTLLGTLLGVSNIQYKKQEVPDEEYEDEEEFDIDENEDYKFTADDLEKTFEGKE